MHQHNQVAPLLQHTLPALNQVSFRLSIDAGSTLPTPAATAAAAGAALLTSVGNLLTRPSRTPRPHLGDHAPQKSAVSRHVQSAQGLVSAQSAEGTVSTQSVMSNLRVGDGDMGGMQTTPAGKTTNR